MTSRRRQLRDYGRFLKKFARSMASHTDDELAVLAGNGKDRAEMEKTLHQCEQALVKYGNQVDAKARDAIARQAARIRHALNNPGIFA